MRGILIFCILGGIFLTATHKTEKQNYLTKKEMKNILAGVTCGGVRCIDWNWCTGQPCSTSPCLTCTNNLKQRACVQSSPDPWICEPFIIEGECGEIVKNGTCILGVCSAAGGEYTGVPCNRDYCSEYLQGGKK